MSVSKVAAAALKLPIHAYRYSLSMLIGRRCRHAPTCSEYALEAIDLNGPWRGFWLAVSRFWRCRPGGTHGFDPAPDIRSEHHPLLAAWRYGRWRARDVTVFAPLDGGGSSTKEPLHGG
jgi:putative membrane protein insertion efficiency factor